MALSMRKLVNMTLAEMENPLPTRVNTSSAFQAVGDEQEEMAAGEGDIPTTGNETLG